jgi:hypothetical protein
MANFPTASDFQNMLAGPQQQAASGLQNLTGVLQAEQDREMRRKAQRQQTFMQLMQLTSQFPNADISKIAGGLGGDELTMAQMDTLREINKASKAELKKQEIAQQVEQGTPAAQAVGQLDAGAAAGILTPQQQREREIAAIRLNEAAPVEALPGLQSVMQAEQAKQGVGFQEELARDQRSEESSLRKSRAFPPTQYERALRSLESGIDVATGRPLTPFVRARYEQITALGDPQSAVIDIELPGGGHIKINPLELNKGDAADELRKKLAGDNAISTIDSLLNITTQAPTQGLIGGLIGSAQTVWGTAEDFTRATGGSTEDAMMDMESTLMSDMLEGNVEEPDKFLDIIRDVDTQVAAEVSTAILAYEAARTIKDQGRINVSDYDTWVRLLDKPTTKQFRSALQTLRAKLVQKRDDKIQILRASGTTELEGSPLGGASGQEPLAPDEDAAVQSIVDRYR